MSEKKRNRELAFNYAKAGYGYSRREQVCLDELWTRESRFDQLANNPRSTAFGIAQLLNETSKEPAIQILHGLKYLSSRYDNSACKALRFHNRNGWY